MQPTFSELKTKFKNLLGLDNIEVASESVRKEREKRSKFIIENEALENEIELFAQGGLLPGDRVEIYRKYFGIE